MTHDFRVSFFGKHCSKNRKNVCKTKDLIPSCRLPKSSIQKMPMKITVPIVWILGGPGCGKGTQCAKIVQKYGYTHLSSGDLLRDEVASGSAKGRELAEIMKEGKLVSNDDVLFLLEKAMQAKVKTATGFLIDGYPREKEQGAAFECKIAPTDLIIFFNCADETMVSRVMARAAASKEKRADDNETTIKTRLATFRANTNQILAMYQEKTVKLNAERTVDEIFHDVVCTIDCMLKRKARAAACASAWR